MKLDEMGVIGHQAKIADNAPSHAGEVGHIITATTERAYIKFANGDKEWFANKYIVGTRKVESVDDQHLLEMAAKATCSKCGKGPIHKTHWYKKGAGWQCKSGGSSETKAEPKKAEEKKPEPKKEAPAEEKKPMTDIQRRNHEANEKAANERARLFHAQLTREIEEREAKKKAGKK
jgi:hypothetical protein